MIDLTSAPKGNLGVAAIEAKRAVQGEDQHGEGERRHCRASEGILVTVESQRQHHGKEEPQALRAELKEGCAGNAAIEHAVHAATPHAHRGRAIRRIASELTVASTKLHLAHPLFVLPRKSGGSVSGRRNPATANTPPHRFSRLICSLARPIPPQGRAGDLLAARRHSAKCRRRLRSRQPRASDSFCYQNCHSTRIDRGRRQ